MPKMDVGLIMGQIYCKMAPFIHAIFFSMDLWCLVVCTNVLGNLLLFTIYGILRKANIKIVESG